MSSYEKKGFLGNWKCYDEQAILSIEKMEETYKCVWKIDRNNLQNEYLGIGV